MSQIATRSDAPKPPQTRHRRRSVIPTAVTLVRWHSGPMWPLLLLLAAGLLSTVMLLTSLPLFTAVAMTAGLHQAIAAQPSNQDIQVTARTVQLTSPIYRQIDQSYNGLIHQYIGDEIDRAPLRTVQVTSLRLYQDTPGGMRTLTRDSVDITASDMTYLAPHMQVVGRLPAPASDALEVALTADTARHIGVQIGDSLTVQYYSSRFSPEDPFPQLLRVVGIVQPNDNDPFWRYHDLTPFLDKSGNHYRVLAAFPAMLTLLDQYAKVLDPRINQAIAMEASLEWLYHFSPNHVTAAQLNDLIGRLDTMKVRLSEAFNFSNVNSLAIFGRLIDPDSPLRQYHDQVATANIPLSFLFGGIAGVALLFVMLLAELLIEQQATAIAAMRSRGFSQWQIFGMFAIQGLGIGGLALLVGGVAAWPVARWLVATTLPGADPAATSQLIDHPFDLVAQVWWYPVAALAGCVAALLVALVRALRLDVLAIRREAARASERPAWQRWNLDLIAAMTAGLGALLALYLRQIAGGLDAEAQRLLMPLDLIAPIVLLLALLLVALRLFSGLLRVGAWLAQRARGALATLALTQLARAPRQAIRMALLLAMALLFAIFLIVFAASQDQRTADVALFSVGADISGTPTPAVTRMGRTLTGQAALDYQFLRYTHLPGVAAAAAGYQDTQIGTEGFVGNLFMLLAVEPASYVQAASWPDSARQRAALAALVAARPQALQDHLVPAVVDDATWQQFHLAAGAVFSMRSYLQSDEDAFRYLAVAHVPAIPQRFALRGTILVDYQTLAQIIAHAPGMHSPIAANMIWIRTGTSASDIALARHYLSGLPWQLQNLQDRRSIAQALRQEPLPTLIVGVNAVGVIIPILLALGGALGASWMRVRRQITSFGVLRALGTAPRQIAAILAWEQGLIYGTALALGAGLGLLFCLLLIPSLLFTTTLTGDPSLTAGDIFRLQNTPPVRLVVPAAAILPLSAAIVLALLALAMMIALLIRPAIGQTLRTDED